MVTFTDIPEDVVKYVILPWRSEIIIADKIFSDYVDKYIINSLYFNPMKLPLKINLISDINDELRKKIAFMVSYKMEMDNTFEKWLYEMFKKDIDTHCHNLLNLPLVKQNLERKL